MGNISIVVVIRTFPQISEHAKIIGNSINITVPFAIKYINTVHIAADDASDTTIVKNVD